jgi:rfaE bifunctional protein kinase chain/domain
LLLYSRTEMTTAEILAQFPRLSVLVIGDICLDRWCTYDPAVSEPSRETGIPRIGVTSTEVTPGGGGTVANNLAALGAGRVSVLGVVGEDGFGFELSKALCARGISPDLLIPVQGLQTFTYTKLLNAQNGVEDQPRVDFISVKPLAPEIEQRIVESAWPIAKDYDVIMVSDQAETNSGGVITPSVREAICEMASGLPGKVFWVDSRMRSELFHNVIIKPNQQEAEAACRRLFGRTDFPELRRRVEAPFIMITHGLDGVLVVGQNGESWARTRPVEHPVDICGAGDSFSAGAALALAVTGSAAAAARMGNLVASITIMKKGTGTASPVEVLEADGAFPQ